MRTGDWVVETKVLKPLLKDWLERYRLQFTQGGRQDNGYGHFGNPHDLIRLKTGLAKDTVRRIERGQSTYTDFDTAEKILILLNREHLFNTGEVEIFTWRPNKKPTPLRLKT